MQGLLTGNFCKDLLIIVYLYLVAIVYYLPDKFKEKYCIDYEESKWHTRPFCSNCNQFLNTDQIYYLNGICPYCSNSSGTTVTEHVLRDARWNRVSNPLKFWINKGHWLFYGRCKACDGTGKYEDSNHCVMCNGTGDNFRCYTMKCTAINNCCTARNGWVCVGNHSMRD